MSNSLISDYSISNINLKIHFSCKELFIIIYHYY